MSQRMTSSDLPQEVINRMSPEDRRDMGLKSTEESRAEVAKGVARNEAKAESKIQAEVEAWLVHNGFRRRSSEDIRRGMPRSGYFIHLHATKKNPILGDIVVLSNSGAYLEVELKTATGSPTAEQACLIAYGTVKLARSSEEAVEIIRQWMEGLSSSG